VLEVEQSGRGDEGGEEVSRTDNDRWAEFEKAVSAAANYSSIDAILNTPDFEIARDVIAMLRTRLQRVEPRHG
jgi:hypothetical protein